MNSLFLLMRLKMCMYVVGMYVEKIMFCIKSLKQFFEVFSSSGGNIVFGFSSSHS